MQAGQDPGDLARLHPLVLPEEISLWPSAPGWWLVGAGLLVVLLVLVVDLARRHRALRFRREALRELAEIRAGGDLVPLPRLLKLVALEVHERRTVAGLSGTAWAAFLDTTGGGGRFGAGAGEELARLAYEGAAPPDPAALLDACERWIRAQEPPR